MLDYDKIAQAMYEAHRTEYASVAVGTTPWANLDAVEQAAWIAAAKAAHKEFKESKS